MVDSRQRDIFPLSFCVAALQPRGSGSSNDSSSISDRAECTELSSKSYRKYLAREHNLSWCRDGVKALNALSGYQFSDLPEPACRNSSQASVFEHLRDRYQQIPKPPAELTPARAFAELCGSSSTYEHLDSLVGSRVPYDHHMVSWPPADTTPLGLESSVDSIDRESVVGWKRHIMRSDDECRMHACDPAKIIPFCEPSLVQGPRIYLQFNRELYFRGMLSFNGSGTANL